MSFTVFRECSAALVIAMLTACGEERTVGDPPPTWDGSSVHGPGVLDPQSPGFHGAVLRDRGWDLALCQSCHGEDHDGGTSGASCLGCHDDGPTACATCHGEDRRYAPGGAHAAHRGACDACHRVPARWDEPGHLDPAPAEVVLGALAARDVEPPRRTAPPRYDATTRTCSDVYCHGGVLADAAATHAAPVWDGPPGQASCGGCHGAPPADHAPGACERCHVASAHLDGALQVGKGCGGCHGDTIGTGGHRSHLVAPSRLRPPVACAECHVVPDDVRSPGHIDTDLPAEVFPAGSGDLARRDGAAPTWDRASATCADVYCHGGATPRWTVLGRGEAACGTCHGLPPSDEVHDPALTIGDCATCHPGVDRVGNILFTGPAGAETSEHLDGTVDLR